MDHNFAGINGIVQQFSWNCLLLCLGAEDFTPEQDVEEVRQIEKQIKRRFAIGTQVLTKLLATIKKQLVLYINSENYSHHDRSVDVNSKSKHALQQEIQCKVIEVVNLFAKGYHMG